MREREREREVRDTHLRKHLRVVRRVHPQGEEVQALGGGEVSAGFGYPAQEVGRQRVRLRLRGDAGRGRAGGRGGRRGSGGGSGEGVAGLRQRLHRALPQQPQRVPHAHHRRHPPRTRTRTRIAAAADGGRGQDALLDPVAAVRHLRQEVVVG